MQSQKRMGREAHLDSDNHAAAPPARGGFSLSLKMKCICFLARPHLNRQRKSSVGGVGCSIFVQSAGCPRVRLCWRHVDDIKSSGGRTSAPPRVTWRPCSTMPPSPPSLDVVLELDGAAYHDLHKSLLFVLVDMARGRRLQRRHCRPWPTPSAARACAAAEQHGFGCAACR